MSDSKQFYRWRPHPWHGLETGPAPPGRLHAFIELTPFDRVKFEVDKKTGYLRVDRPQRTSSFPPALYGFVPRTYCGAHVGALSPAGRGDGDPLDICVVAEQPIHRGEVIVDVRVVGGIQMIDNGEADDKIIAILDSDDLWTHVLDIADLPDVMVERLLHYFSTYKQTSARLGPAASETYGRERALEVVHAAIQDYEDEFGLGRPLDVVAGT